MTKPLIITPIKTSVFAKGEDLVSFILENTPSSLWKEEAVLAVTSKIVSIAENRLFKKSEITKQELITQEADHYLGELGYGAHLTITHGLLIASAGIDESNSEEDEFIVYPLNPYRSAQNLRQEIMRKTGLQNLGVILTDSRTGPLRRGVVGTCLAYSGFEPVESKVGAPDLFGRPLAMTKVNLADSLAAAAVLTMGEAAEQTPLAFIENSRVRFNNNSLRSDLEVSVENDMYKNLYSHLIQK